MSIGFLTVVLVFRGSLVGVSCRFFLLFSANMIVFQFNGLGRRSLSKWTRSEKPQFIFELVYSNEQEAKFQSIAGSHGVFLAYHGSSVENFHSILHNGLLNLFNKVWW